MFCVRHKDLRMTWDKKFVECVTPRNKTAINLKELLSNPKNKRKKNEETKTLKTSTRHSIGEAKLPQFLGADDEEAAGLDYRTALRASVSSRSIPEPSLRSAGRWAT